MATKTLELTDTRRDAVAAAADIVGAKWTALLIYDLADSPKRFRELETSCAGISSRTLAERLRALEASDVVRRHSYPASPPRVEYELTAKGRDLLPIVDAMTEFGRAWNVS
jgi:DNA-binding HxlR family transcriptional regulator